LAPGRCKLRGRAWVGSENRQLSKATTTATTPAFSTSGSRSTPRYVEGFVEGCLERIVQDAREGEMLLRASGRRGMER
jgi:hypothetical protein